MGHGPVRPTTSELGGSSSPKRRRLNANQADMVVGGMSSLIISLLELPFEVSKHATAIPWAGVMRFCLSCIANYYTRCERTRARP